MTTAPSRFSKFRRVVWYFMFVITIGVLVTAIELQVIAQYNQTAKTLQLQQKTANLMLSEIEVIKQVAIQVNSPTAHAQQVAFFAIMDKQAKAIAAIQAQIDGADTSRHLTMCRYQPSVTRGCSP